MKAQFRRVVHLNSHIKKPALLCNVASSVNGPFRPQSWQLVQRGVVDAHKCVGGVKPCHRRANLCQYVSPCQSPSHHVLDENGSLSSPTFAICVGVEFAWTRVRTVSPQVSIESLAKRTQQVYQSKTCWSWLCRSLVQGHWCRSLPRVRGNPSSFDIPEQSTDQSLEPFHQRWASLVADTTGLRHRWKVSSALIRCFTVGSLFLVYFSHDGQHFFRRCRLKQLV